MATASAVETPAEPPSETTAQPETKGAAELSLPERLHWTNRVILNHSVAAAGIGLLPLPVMDVVALTGVQLNLLRKLGTFYNVSFRDDLGKKLIGAMLGGYTPIALASPVASVFKLIPLVGWTVGALAASVTAGAGTYALGKVFVQHFESGGTFLDFDPATVQEYFREQFLEGREVVKKAAPTKGSGKAAADQA